MDDRFTEEELRVAKSVDLKAIASQLGYTVKRVGKYYTLKEMDSHVDSGSNPNEMAEAIFAIIQTDKPKVHYKVGAFMQKFSIVLKRILPDTVYEKMLMNH